MRRDSSVIQAAAEERGAGLARAPGLGGGGRLQGRWWSAHGHKVTHSLVPAVLSERRGPGLRGQEEKGPPRAERFSWVPAQWEGGRWARGPGPQPRRRGLLWAAEPSTQTGGHDAGQGM